MVIVRGAPEAAVSGRIGGKPVSAVIRPNCGTAWRRLHVLLTGS